MTAKSFINGFIISALVFTAVDVSAQTAVTKKINNYLDEAMKGMNLAGLTVAITRNDSVIYTKALGYRNIETREQLTVNHVFHWASVSKTFVATAIMQLVEQHKININDKLTKYLPYYRQKDDFYKDITIRQMLNHTSGIGDVNDYGWDNPQYDSGALERFVRSTLSDPMLFAPGTSMRYSNTAYETLGAVVAAVSGMSFETYVRKNIFAPLEMNITSFLYTEIPESLRVSGHRGEGKITPTKHYPYNRMHGPSSTLNSNVIEMAHFAMAHLHRGTYKGKRILSDATYDLWWKNTVNMQGKPQIGFAWWLEDRNGVKTVGHSGGDTGFRSHLILIPETNTSVMLVSNTDSLKPFHLAAGLIDILMGIEPLPPK